MTFYDQDVDIEDEEPVELPEVWLSKPGPCCTCGGLDQRYGCFRCGSPVCMDATNYMKDSACGGWIMDWWSNGAKVENEFWCRSCLEGLLGPPTKFTTVRSLAIKNPVKKQLSVGKSYPFQDNLTSCPLLKRTEAALHHAFWSMCQR